MEELLLRSDEPLADQLYAYDCGVFALLAVWQLLWDLPHGAPNQEDATKARLLLHDYHRGTAGMPAMARCAYRLPNDLLFFDTCPGCTTFRPLLDVVGSAVSHVAEDAGSDGHFQLRGRDGTPLLPGDDVSSRHIAVWVFLRRSGGAPSKSSKVDLVSRERIEALLVAHGVPANKAVARFEKLTNKVPSAAIIAAPLPCNLAAWFCLTQAATRRHFKIVMASEVPVTQILHKQLGSASYRAAARRQFKIVLASEGPVTQILQKDVLPDPWAQASWPSGNLLRGKGLRPHRRHMPLLLDCTSLTACVGIGETMQWSALLICKPRVNSSLLT